MKVYKMFVIGQCCGDEEDGVGSVGAGFVDLRLIYDEIFS